MKKLVLSILLLSFLPLNVLPKPLIYYNLPQANKSKPATDWKEYISKTGNFAVLLPPGQPVEESTPQIRVRLDQGPRTYGVARLDGFKFAETAQKTVDGAADDFLNTSEGRLVDKTVLAVGGYPGASIKFQTAEPPGTTEARFFLVGRYMYAVIAFTRNGSSEDEANKFLNSFRLLNNKV